MEVPKRTSGDLGMELSVRCPDALYNRNTPAKYNQFQPVALAPSFYNTPPCEVPMPLSIHPSRRLPLTSILGFWLLLTLLLLSSGPAYAEWVRVGETDTYTGYIDPKTIRLRADFAKMWGLYDNKTAQSSSAVESYLSIKTLDEYDCMEKQTRNLG